MAKDMGKVMKAVMSALTDLDERGLVRVSLSAAGPREPLVTLSDGLRRDANRLFGAAASLVVVLLWVYYSAQIFLFGAEFSWAWCHKFGSRRGRAMPEATHLEAAPR